ncbi:MAG: peptidylprolyl isomerase [Pontiellaceae bacterium]|nr:peptidylprolyl isomerase [Pontiellaceae bacterium]
MFDKFVNKRIMLILSAVAAFALTGCKRDKATVPDESSADLQKSGEDLFSNSISKNKVIARVNGQEVMSSDADRLFIPYAMQLRQIQESGSASLEQLQTWENQAKNRVINELIQQTLLKAAAADDEGVAVDSVEVDEVINAQIARLPEGQTLEEILSLQGLTMDDARKEVETKLAIAHLLDRKTADVTPQSAYDELVRPGSVTISHILLRTGSLDEEAKAKQKADLERIRTDIIDGKITFADAAKMYSEDPESRDNGGEYEKIVKGKMPPALDDVIFSQKIGDVSEVIETAYGYHIVTVSKRHAAKFFDEMSEEELADVVARKKDMILEEYMKSLMEDVDIEWVNLISPQN